MKYNTSTPNDLKYNVDEDQFSSAYRNVYDSMSETPSSLLAFAQDTLVRSLGEAGVWSKLDLFYVFKTNNNVDALLNWVDPGTFDCISHGTENFTAYDGFTGNGTDFYLDTQYKPSTDGVNYALDDAMLGVVNETSDYTDLRGLAGCVGTTHDVNIVVRTTNWQYNINAGVARAFAHSSLITGTVSAERADSSNMKMYARDGALVQDNATASTGLPDVNIAIFGRGASNLTLNKLSFAFVGASLLDAERTALINAINEYKDYVDGMIVNTEDLLIYRDSGILTTSSKYNADYDLIIRFKLTMQNDLMTFQEIGLRENTKPYILKDLPVTVDISIGNWDAADAMGPYYLNTLSDFVGGNHVWQGSAGYTLLTSNYDPVDTEMGVTDASQFIQTGGGAITSGGERFTYSGYTGNTLEGVDLSTSITTSDGVRISQPTAYNDSFTFEISSVTVPAGYTYTDQVDITAVNEILDMSTLSLVDGSADILLEETVVYHVLKGNIDIDYSIVPQKDAPIATYTSMQFSQNFWDTVYMANGEGTDIVNIANGVNSGDFDTYYSDRWVCNNSDKTINVSALVDSIGLGLDRSMPATDQTVFCLNNKIYHRFIGELTTLSNGVTYNWKGDYTIFDYTNLASKAYKIKRTSGEKLYVDLHESGVLSLSIGDYSSVTESDKTGDVSFSYSSPVLKVISSSDYTVLILDLTP